MRHSCHTYACSKYEVTGYSPPATRTGDNQSDGKQPIKHRLGLKWDQASFCNGAGNYEQGHRVRHELGGVALPAFIADAGARPSLVRRTRPRAKLETWTRRSPRIHPSFDAQTMLNLVCF